MVRNGPAIGDGAAGPVVLHSLPVENAKGEIHGQEQDTAHRWCAAEWGRA
jgi:hypothetical protein